MITNVTIPARLCTCEANLKDGSPCGYQWISISVQLPQSCQNRECRSRLWNGKKPRKQQEKKPSVILPKPNKVRGGNDEDEE